MSSLTSGLKQDATFIMRLILTKGSSRLTYGPWNAQACAHEAQAGLSEGEGDGAGGQYPGPMCEANLLAHV